MFSLSGRRTPLSTATQSILENSGLPLNPRKKKSFALVLYRKDPIDQYYYLTAYAGLREIEPMYGPLNFSDFRRGFEAKSGRHYPTRFKTREETVWVETIDRPLWQLHINGRSKKLKRKYSRKIQQLEQQLDLIFDGETLPVNQPLYPELWYAERLARDLLRNNVQALPPGRALEEVVQHLRHGLREMFSQWLPNPSMTLGIYLDTGFSWDLISPTQMRPWVPLTVAKTAPNEPVCHAFDWAERSTAPLLLTKEMSKRWRRLIGNCGTDFIQVINSENFAGMCIVPIIHPNEPWRSMGMLLLTTRGSPLFPAHHYLLTRLATAVSVYLMPLIPIQGFPWWPSAKMQRGGAQTVWVPEDSAEDTSVPKSVVEGAAQNLMPKNAKVELETLSRGLSGADVFQLRVTDERGIPEVPRVMKISSQPKLIEDELKRYYRYVHNKKVGGSSRVDIARGFRQLHLNDIAKRSEEPMYGAIVYTFVGAGDDALPWANWIERASADEFKKGFELLHDQLSDWHSRIRPMRCSPIDLLIRPLAMGGLKNYLTKKVAGPSFAEVQAMLTQLCEVQRHRIASTTITSVVHGDLHGGNIFAILTPEQKIKDVALIDWGHVQSDRHPLSDIAKLAADLLYGRGLYGQDSALKDVILEQLQQRGEQPGRNRMEWRLAMINQLARMLFYRRVSVGSEASPVPYLADNARLAAWDFLRECAGVIVDDL